MTNCNSGFQCMLEQWTHHFNNRNSYALRSPEQKEVVQRMVQYLPQAKVFLDLNVCSPQVVDNRIESLVDSGVDVKLLNLPFQTCCFIIETSVFEDVRRFGFLVHEVTPMNYIGVMIWEFNNHEFQASPFSSEDTDLLPFDFIQWCLYNLQHPNKQIGSVPVNIRGKFHQGNVKSFFKIRQVLIVNNKNQATTHIPGISSPIDWDISWDVRGHWRRIEGIGKDRNNNRTVEKMTWVREHLKGNKNTPAIQQLRVIK